MPKIPKKRENAESGRRLKKRRGKNSVNAKKIFDAQKLHTVDEAVELLKSPEFNKAKFTQTVEVAVRLGVDPRKSDQMVRGAVVLPHGTGKTVRLLVFAKGEKAKEAEEAGADIVGGEDIVEKIQKEGWMDFDKAIATPDMMRHVGRIGKLLGPRGLMPSPKDGTVTFDVSNAVKEQKAGKVSFRVDKAGIVHSAIGRADFTEQQIKDNLLALVGTLIRLKPQTAKGIYMRRAAVSMTQSPGVRLDTSDLQAAAKGK
ncbi:MAG TPA: 50S ribosomal protein L1 [Myxococcales bacterium]|nr:50S ribosomal protein L1 [Deltaproteobacteria bacterium]MBU48202.1 50S ribosomal protein L1 [Deltaproteobacteria bacterium]HAA57132.1 50S ribosomal protein L1 [Myxococcales bacterium]|tara:strand:- start:882 stop:1652 length:771 start_codon:yes stop_codon:yes gene_type:complete